MKLVQGRTFFTFSCITLVLLLVQASNLRADSESKPLTASLSTNLSVEKHTSTHSYAPPVVSSRPIYLDGGTTVTLLYPTQWASLAQNTSETLSQTHQNLNKLLGPIPSFTVSVRLMEESLFFLSTKAPVWTNALFYRGQILIPVTLEKDDDSNLLRSARHEFTHAAVHALSQGKCPGWIDEGLAQWAEGKENPLLQEALLSYLKENPPISLKLLQGGFTKLSKDMVAAAYAQSLFAVRALVSQTSVSQLRQYFDLLQNGELHKDAFQKSFLYDEEAFEKQLHQTLEGWSSFS